MGLNPYGATMSPDAEQHGARMAAQANTTPGGGLDADHVPSDAPRLLTGFLVSFDDNELGAFWPLYQGQAIVGRKDAADGLDIEIDHPTTSSRHAVFYVGAKPGRVMVEDTGSTNGTFLNDEKLPPGARRALPNGATVRFGGFNVTLYLI